MKQLSRKLFFFNSKMNTKGESEARDENIESNGKTSKAGVALGVLGLLIGIVAIIIAILAYVKLNSFETDITQAENTLEARLTAKTQDLNASLNSQKADLEAQIKSTSDSALKTIQTDAQNLTQTLDGIKSQAQTLQSQYSNLQNGLKDANTQSAKLQSGVKDANSQLSKLQTDFTSLKSQFDTSTASNLTTKISKIDSVFSSDYKTLTLNDLKFGSKWGLTHAGDEFHFYGTNITDTSDTYPCTYMFIKDNGKGTPKSFYLNTVEPPSVLGSTNASDIQTTLQSNLTKCAKPYTFQ